MSAVRALAEARAAGVGLRPGKGGALRVLARPTDIPPGLLHALREHKPALLALLSGDLCRHCGEPMGWPRPVGVMLADGTAAHHACDEAWYAAEAKRKAENCFSPEALADTAELCLRGELE